MVSCCIPWQGKQKYQATNIAMKSKIVTFASFSYFRNLTVNESQQKRPPTITVKAILVNGNCKLFLGLERNIHTAKIISYQALVSSYSAKEKILS